MAKHKTKNKVLTKIDPSVLKSKHRAPAVSQHSASNGIRVTTTVKPTRQLPPATSNPLADPYIFGPDVLNLDEEHLQENDDDGDISRGYYVARVWTFVSLYCVRGSSPPG